MKEIIKGYKCFYKGLINLYDEKFETNKLYITSGNIKYGIDGNGFHMCKNIEDTLRFFDKNKELEICKVIGFGNFDKHEDNYYDYYDMYSVEKLYISKILTREEIINIALNLPEIRLKRFIQGFLLNEEEINKLKNKFNNNNIILNYIAYYQNNNHSVFKLTLDK